MLYDGAITFLQRAIAAMEAGNIQMKCNNLNRALAIIVQLEGSLNFEQGGEVAQTLKSFYVYARAQAMKAHAENSPETLRALIENFTTVRDAWRAGERRLATQGASLAANGGSGRTDWSDAGTVELSVFD
jgi:flagellar protein FliS